MTNRQINEHDVSAILWDLEMTSIFFDEPLEVEIPGFGTHSVGTGLGGFAWSFFQRGFNCVACGNCCQSLNGQPFNRRLWFWYANEPRPVRESIQELQIKINGIHRVIAVHINEHQFQCDFLGPKQWVESDGIYDEIPLENMKFVKSDAFPDLVPQQYCTIHSPNEKPAHCMIYPGAAVYRPGKAKIPVLSRRLPGRNWRWPQCPVDLHNSPMRQEDLDNDEYVLSVWQGALGDLPHSRVSECVELWRQTTRDIQATGKAPQTNVLFKEAL